MSAFGAVLTSVEDVQPIVNSTITINITRSENALYCTILLEVIKRIRLYFAMFDKLL